MSQFKNWKMAVDDQQIMWLGFDRHDARVNTINSEVLDELNLILQDAAHQSSLKGLVIYSMKTQGFVAGADVHEFAHFTSQEQISNFLRKGQSVFTRLENLTIPTVAMIDGFCMGGGLELALACDYRIATEESKLGLPEVKLGIHPGWGGTVRLPKLIGSFQALSEVILTGAAVSAKRAKSLGMIDDYVPKRQLKRAAIYFITHRPALHQPGRINAFTNVGMLRTLIGKGLKFKVSQKISQKHYPAPFAVIDLWEKEGAFDERAYLKEADSVEKLITTSDTAPNLIRVFLLRERLKSFAKKNDHPVKHVHVIGAGVMGGDIAAWCAFRGLTVTLQDQSMERIAPAIGRAAGLYQKLLRQPRLVQACLDKLTPDPQGFGIKTADVIIEAVFEDLEVKQTIMQDVEAKAKPDALIATNTSSIPLNEINQVMTHPERLVGIHFFNPVSKMELVEVVHDVKTSAETQDRACAFVEQIGRLPLPVKSSPGFLINRVLMPYLLEAMTLLEEGVRAEVIDKAACEFGMLMGPIELADAVGLDICLAVAQNLTAHLGGTVPSKLENMVASKHLGRKTSEGGFYHYKNGKAIKKKVNAEECRPDIAKRLIDAMVQEAQTCLKEGVVEDGDLVDAGMIFGTGFAPFRGGPINYTKTMRQKKDQASAHDIDEKMPTE